MQYYLGDLVDEGEDPLVVEINTTDDIFTYIWFYADTLVNCNFAYAGTEDPLVVEVEITSDNGL